MKVDVFIRSYSGDFEWLGHCLKSCERFLHNFGAVHVVVPEEDISGIQHLTKERIYAVKDACSGYMAQQVTKLHADNYTDADYILHVDSDCVFFVDTKPEDFFDGGKPIMLRESGVDSPWNIITQRALGWYDEYEYMRRMPILYPRWIYKMVRDWMQTQHGIPLEQYICSQPGREFSEFNTVGQWAYRYYPNSFVWKNPGEHPLRCKQFWSWGGIESARQEIEKLLT